MLDSVVFFSAFTIVEAVESADEIAGNASDPVERNVSEFKLEVDEIAVSFDSHFRYLSVLVLIFAVIDVSVDLLLRDLFTDDINLHIKRLLCIIHKNEA